MIQLIRRILSSLVALPFWVIVWMFLFLIPANLSGLLFLDTVAGLWITLLGGGALAVNTILVLINRGFSRALAIPHVLLWGPLEIFLAVRLAAVPPGGDEWWLALVVFVVNGISLIFDIYDTVRWWRGERQVIGFETEPARL